MVAPTRHPFVSIVLPARNEARFIAACLDSILAFTYPRDRMEILVAEGMSEDRTRAIVAQYAARHREIRLIDNPRRIVPSGLNAAIRVAVGDVILRVDAHALYPPDYVNKLVAELEASGADNVGGVQITLPSAATPIARAIARGLAHPMGVGNAYFRTGSARPRWVDAVPFGCYRREVFERIGFFDEEMLRNEDDEFNFRLRRHRGRILLVPTVTCCYFARATLGKLARQFYQYGYWKPFVARKVGGVRTVRQVVPALSLASLAAAALAGVWWGASRLATLALIGSYTAMVLGSAVGVARRDGLRCGLAFVAVLPVLHGSYGLGYLLGSLHFWLPPLRRFIPTAVPLVR